MSIIHRSRASKQIDGFNPSLSAQIFFREPAVVSTLPFDPLYVRRDRTEEALQRTAKRWEWFDEAQKIDPTLGTLIHLPLEIRRHIWDMVLQCHDTLSVDGLWEYDHLNGAPFNLSAYYFGFGRRRFQKDSVTGLRLVSSSVRTEFDDIFLSQRTFRFNKPESLDTFVNRLTSYQLSRLHSFEIGLTVCLTTSMEVWSNSMELLPSDLRDIHFRIYPARNGWFGAQRITSGISGVNYGREVHQEEFDLLHVLVKRAVQKASKARVTITSAAKDHMLSERCQIAVDAIIADSRQHQSHV